MKSIFAILFIGFLSNLFGQDAFLSSGSSIKTNDTEYNYSVGEPFATSYEGDNNQNIQIGVQQPFIDYLVEVDQFSSSICLYPNPADQKIHLRANGTESYTELHYIIFSIDGKLRKQGNLIYNFENEIYLEDLPSGEYTIVIEELNQTTKFVKI
jgi:Secretion system C-terminal sorting domain